MDDGETIAEITNEYLQRGEVPQSVYFNDDVHRNELEKVFGRSWLFVGHVSEVKAEGDYTRRYLGDDQFIFCRDEEGEIQVLFNSCRHRGARICEAEQGNTSHFRCPYHGWTYRNDGDLIGIPDRDETYGDIDTEQWELLGVPRVETYRGMVFASFDADIEPLEDYLGDLTWYIDGHLDLIEGGLEVVGEPMRWRIDTNWKMPVENNSTDTYHVQLTHKSIIDITFKKENKDAARNSHFKVIDIGEGHSAFYRMYDDEFADRPELADRLYFYPEDVRDQVNEEIDDSHIKLGQRSTVAGGRVFPNMTFVRGGARQERGQEDVDFFVIFMLRPVSPSETEIWYWILAPKCASEEYKKTVYRVAAMHDGTSGMAQMDDTAVLNGISQSANSYFAQQNRAGLNFQQGKESAIDSDWPGPGIAYHSHTDATERSFYEEWSECMLSPEESRQ